MSSNLSARAEIHELNELTHLAPLEGKEFGRLVLNVAIQVLKGLSSMLPATPWKCGTFQLARLNVGHSKNS